MSARYSRSDVAILSLAVIGCLPALVLRYLPMTDLPQHLAVTSILAHDGGGASQLSAYFSPSYTKTLYLAPYLATLALGKLVTLRMGLQIVVFAALLAYPVGLFALLRSLGKPAGLTLLGLPLVYSRAVSWGFINFQASLGLCLLGMSLLVRPGGRSRSAWLGLIAALLVFTHTHGLILLLAFGAIQAALERSSAAVRALVPLVPAALGAGVWLVLAGSAPGYGEPASPLFSDRLNDLASSTLSVYADGSQTWLFVAFVATAAALGWRNAPIDGARLAALSSAERTLWVLATANVALYFVLPEHTPTAKFIHFRHAIMAAMLVPALASLDLPALLVKRAAVLAIGTFAVASAWVHWSAFDGEARSFDEILAALPPAPRLLSLIYDRDGEIMGTAPYLHFGGYAQAERGGDLSTSFAMFWNVPIERTTPGPSLPRDFEWQPQLYDDRDTGPYFTHALVRREEGLLPASARFPFELAKRSGPWQLYRRIESGGLP